MSEMNRPRLVTARKDHKCGECYRTVGAGERYWYMAGLSTEGDFGTWKTCQHCSNLRRQIMDYDDDWFAEGGWIGDWFSERMHRECEIPEADAIPILRRHAEFRRKWRDAAGNLYQMDPQP